MRAEELHLAETFGSKHSWLLRRRKACWPGSLRRLLLDDAIEFATGGGTCENPRVTATKQRAEMTSSEVQDEEGEEHPGRDPAAENLLTAYCKGVLPCYAFQRIARHVFDQDRSTLFRPRSSYAFRAYRPRRTRAGQGSVDW